MSRAALPLNLYGYALVNANGSTVFISPNLTISKPGTGSYILQPADHLTQAQCAPMVFGVQAPIIGAVAYGLGATADGIQVLTFNGAAAGAAADEAFYFYLYTIGATAYSVNP